MTILVLMNGEGHSLRDLQSADYFEGYVWNQLARVAAASYVYRQSPNGPWVLFDGSGPTVLLPANLDMSTMADEPLSAELFRSRILKGPGGAYYWLGWKEADLLGNIYTSKPGELYRLHADAPPELIWAGSRPASLYTPLNNIPPADVFVTPGPEHVWIEYDGGSLTYFDLTTATSGEVITFSGSTFSPASFATTPDVVVRGHTPAVPVTLLQLQWFGAKLPGLQLMEGVTGSNTVLYLSDGTTVNIPSDMFNVAFAGAPQTFNGVGPVEEPTVWQDFVGAAKEWPY